MLTDIYIRRGTKMLAQPKYVVENVEFLAQLVSLGAAGRGVFCLILSKLDFQKWSEPSIEVFARSSMIGMLMINVAALLQQLCCCCCCCCSAAAAAAADAAADGFAFVVIWFMMCRMS